MNGLILDETDRKLLHALQEDARNITAKELAEKASVSPSTVRNRIEDLKANGVIQGYHPHINYENAGYKFHVLIICRAPPTERSTLTNDVLQIPGIVNVTETLTGQNNIYIEAAAEDSDAVDTISKQINDTGLEITTTDVIKEIHTQPFNHFGTLPDTDSQNEY